MQRRLHAEHREDDSEGRDNESWRAPGARAADPTMTIMRIGQGIADDAWEPAACDAMDVSGPGEVV